MKLRGAKKAEEREEQLPLPEKKERGIDKGKKKKVETEGSRWAALGLLLVTLGLGVWFYLQGLGGYTHFIDTVRGLFSGWGGQSTYVFEKN